MADTEKKSLSKDHANKLYRVRDKNYNTNSPHHIELTKLIKEGNVDGLKAFGAEKFLEGPARDEYEAAVENKTLSKPRQVETEDSEDDDETF